jgi:hypothetical protein
VTLLVIVWYFTFPRQLWEQTPNYLELYVNFIFARPQDAFLFVDTGPNDVISWLFIPVYSLILIHVILYFFGKWRRQRYHIVNRYYLVYLVVLALFAISFHNASQHYGWYWNSELEVPGYVDTWTHITSPWLLGALFAPFYLERYFHWDRKFMWIFILGFLTIAAFGWEISETVGAYYFGIIGPKFFNYPMDSMKDIILGAGIGTLLSCWIYERLVIDLGE